MPIRERIGARDFQMIKDEVQASVARCLRTPPYAARRKGLVSATRTAYAARAIAGARLLLATVHFGPITVVPHRDKANPFRRSSILFRPHGPPIRAFGGVAGYRPRVRSVYYERVYVHRQGRTPDIRNIGVSAAHRKERTGLCLAHIQ